MNSQTILSQSWRLYFWDLLRQMKEQKENCIFFSSQTQSYKEFLNVYNVCNAHFCLLLNWKAYYGKVMFHSFNSILSFIGLTPNVISYFKVDPRLCEVNEKLSLKSRWKKYSYYGSICFYKIEIINLTEIYYFIFYFSYLTFLCALTKCPNQMP